MAEQSCIVASLVILIGIIIKRKLAPILIMVIEGLRFIETPWTEITWNWRSRNEDSFTNNWNWETKQNDRYVKIIKCRMGIKIKIIRRKIQESWEPK